MDTNSLELLRDRIQAEFPWFYYCNVYNDIIIIENEYDSPGEDKNCDDCCDEASNIGNDIVSVFPMLDVVDCSCHKNKYSIIHLKLKED